MNTPSPRTTGCYFGLIENDDFTQFNELNSTGEFEDISNKIIPSASTDFFYERKQPIYDNILLRPTTQIDTSPFIYEYNYDFNQSEELLKFDKEEAPINDKDDSKSMTVEHFLQNPIFDFDFDMHDMQDLSPFKAPVGIDSNPEVNMRFEVDPIKRFRGRTLGDFKPKKTATRKGKPSIPRPPRYFTDGNTRQYLNLLIPKAFLSTDSLHDYLEICIVTREINGYTYIHPYFKFQVHPTDPHAPNLNPICKIIDPTIDTKPYVDELYYQMKLKLVVVMLTNNELMQAEQPLKVFSAPTTNNNESPMAIIYTKHDAFKQAYHLHDMRIAITLWKKKSGEKVFNRHDDKQYIGSISHEDKTAKKNEMLF